MKRPDPGTIAQFARNFAASEIPLARRVLVTLRNLSIRVSGRRACCGHDGEPGC